MADTPEISPEEFAKTREHEYQDPHYHDEDAGIIDDEEAAPHAGKMPLTRKKTPRRPPPQRRYYED